MKCTTIIKLWDVKKHEIAASYYSDKCKGLSRFFGDQTDQLGNFDQKLPLPYPACRYCKTHFLPGNHIVRFSPQHKHNKKALKLLDKSAENKYVAGKMNQHLVKNALNNNVTKIISCNTCKKRTKCAVFSKPPKKIKPCKELEVKEKKPVRVLTPSEKEMRKKNKAAKRQGHRIGIGIVQSPTASPAPSPPVKSVKVRKVDPTTPKSLDMKDLLKPGKVSKKKHDILQRLLHTNTNKKVSSKPGLESFLSNL